MEAGRPSAKGGTQWGGLVPGWKGPGPLGGWERAWGGYLLPGSDGRLVCSPSISDSRLPERREAVSVKFPGAA